MKGYKVVYSIEGIDRSAGFPSANEKWLELFGEPFDRYQAVRVEDLGDTVRYYMPNGYVFENRYGEEETIYEPLATPTNTTA